MATICQPIGRADAAPLGPPTGARLRVGRQISAARPASSAQRPTANAQVVKRRRRDDQSKVVIGASWRAPAASRKLTKFARPGRAPTRGASLRFRAPLIDLGRRALAGGHRCGCARIKWTRGASGRIQSRGRRARVGDKRADYLTRLSMRRRGGLAARCASRARGSIIVARWLHDLGRRPALSGCAFAAPEDKGAAASSTLRSSSSAKLAATWRRPTRTPVDRHGAAACAGPAGRRTWRWRKMAAILLRLAEWRGQAVGTWGAKRAQTRRKIGDKTRLV